VYFYRDQLWSQTSTFSLCCNATRIALFEQTKLHSQATPLIFDIAKYERGSAAYIHAVGAVVVAYGKQHETEKHTAFIEHDLHSLVCNSSWFATTRPPLHVLQYSISSEIITQ